MKLLNLYRPTYAYVVFNLNGEAVASFFNVVDAENFRWVSFGHFGSITITDYLY